jgi:hypothetical protein
MVVLVASAFSLLLTRLGAGEEEAMVVLVASSFSLLLTLLGAV